MIREYTLVCVCGKKTGWFDGKTPLLRHGDAYRGLRNRKKLYRIVCVFLYIFYADLCLNSKK